LSLLVTLQSDRQLTTVFAEAIANEEGIVVDAIASHKLESLGLVEYDLGSIKPICQLYRLYFQQQLSI